MSAEAVRGRSFLDFNGGSSEATSSGPQRIMRARRFVVEWRAFDGGSTPSTVASEAEVLVVVAEGLVHVRSSGTQVTIPADAVAILPPGMHELLGEVGSRCAVLASQRADLHEMNAADDPNGADVISASTPAFRRRGRLTAPQVLTFDQIKASADKPRLKMLQTETMSINIVGYEGPRDRSALSPHSHAEFEQGSLALKGDFVHHLRTPWGGNADLWRADEHLPAGSPSLVIIPEQVIHTTEGVGDVRHLLIDIFSPPRADFIASGWVFNAGDYAAAGAAE